MMIQYVIGDRGWLYTVHDTRSRNEWDKHTTKKKFPYHPMKFIRHLVEL